MPAESSVCHHHMAHRPGWWLTFDGTTLEVHRPDGSTLEPEPPAGTGFR